MSEVKVKIKGDGFKVKAKGSSVKSAMQKLALAKAKIDEGEEANEGN